GPWLFGVGFVAAILGVGRWICGAFSAAQSIERRLVAGAAVVALISALYCLRPQEAALAHAACGLLALGAASELVHAWQLGRGSPMDAEPWARWIAPPTLLLIASIVVETYGSTSNRVVPFDFLLPLNGARFLNSGLI